MLLKQDHGDLHQGECSPSENILLTRSFFSLRGNNTNIGNNVNIADGTNKGVDVNNGINVNVCDNTNEA